MDDKRAVLMVYNFLGTHSVDQVYRKSKGNEINTAVDCPTGVYQYKFLGSVNMMDQKKVTYQFDHRSKYKYYLCNVNYLIDIGVINAEIIFNKASDQADQLNLKSFQIAIANSLLGIYRVRHK